MDSMSGEGGPRLAGSEGRKGRRRLGKALGSWVAGQTSKPERVL